MTAASTLSLLTLFVVDLVDMFFLSLLGEVELAAAIGYAGSILFFTTSVCIGLSIGASALVAQALGRGDTDQARGRLISSYAAALLVTAPTALAVWIAVPALLTLVGADGRAHTLAGDYLRVLIPSMPVLGVAMASNAALRAVGDARRSMWAMVGGGLVNALLDPLLIFGFGPLPGYGVTGAALASVAARVTILALSLYFVVRVHGLAARFSPAAFARDLAPFFRIALPAMLTSVATPIGNAYVVASLAAFGTGAVAGGAIISRIVPVAFSALFALSGALGPIVGQNYGAARHDRVRRTLADALWLVVVYVLLVWLALFLFQDRLIAAFDASGDAAALLALFCTWIAASYAFNGVSFATNAAFNNVDRAYLATVFNIGKATLGTVPFVYAGALWFGAGGVLIGQALGAAVFGVAGAVCAFWLTTRLAGAGRQPAASVGG